MKRHFLRKYAPTEINVLITSMREKILSTIDPPLQIIVFGSALTDHFDDFSDLDFVLVFLTPTEARSAEKKIYRNAHTFPRAADFLCVDQQTFQKKSERGGVYWIAAREGRIIFGAQQAGCL